MNRLIFVFLALMWLMSPVLAEAQSYGAALVVPSVAAGNCPTWNDSINKLSDSGIGCGNGVVAVTDGVHPGSSIIANFGSGHNPSITNNASGIPLLFGRFGFSASSSDIADFEFNRTASYTGGTSGFVNGPVRITDTVSAGGNAFEWGLTSIMDDSRAVGDATEDVAVYGQTKKRNGGGTWALVGELQDMNANPNSPSSTQELDLEVVGTDTHSARVLNDLWGKSWDGNTANITYGMRINTDAHTTVGNGIKYNGAFGTGIDMTGSTYVGDAILLPDGNKIALEGTGTDYLYHTGGVLYYHVGGGNLFSFADSSGAFTANSLQAASGSIILQSGQTVCLNGATCSIKLYWDGSSHVVIANGGTGLLSIDTSGNLSVTKYFSGLSGGTSCSGTPSASFASVNGIVTHC